MSRIYDSWEKLVGAVLRREKDRQLAFCESFDTTFSDLSSRFSLDLDFQDGEACRSCCQNIFSFSSNVVAFDFDELRKAAEYFQYVMVSWEEPPLFRHVYKGWIDEQYAAVNPEFGIAVAIKKLKNKGSYQRQNEWVDEINNLGQVRRHPNLVTFIGYSFEGDNWFLVHEFMSKGSLAHHLFGRGCEVLSWATRTKIALGVARALAFLHNLEVPVMHQNVKSSKIFLDCEFNAKLRDYDGQLPYYKEVGLPPKASELHPAAILLNSDGYTDPEIGLYTIESDVYSFGVVMVELISGLPAFDKKQPYKDHLLLDRINFHRKLNRKTLSKIMDSRLEGKYPHEKALEFAKIASLCVSFFKENRPKVAAVVDLLEKL